MNKINHSQKYFGNIHGDNRKIIIEGFFKILRKNTKRGDEVATLKDVQYDR